jgi:hypothetical protein
MTRGRHDNTALVVCDQLDDEHRDTPPTAAELLTAALGRVSAQTRSALAIRLGRSSLHAEANDLAIRAR